MEFILLAIAAAIAALIYKAQNKPREADIPTPTVLRTDLYAGYYGVMNDQAEKTVGFVNCLWECNFQGHVKAGENILTAKVDTVISLGDQLFTRFADSGRNHRVAVNAKQQLTDYFNYLDLIGALQYVKAVTPFDEPNTQVESAAELMKSIQIIKEVAAGFPVLAGLKLAVIYAAKPETYDCIEMFDFVGVDDYEALSGMLTDGTYGRMKARLRPDQKTILLPGGAFGQDPTPFINFAHNNPEVLGVLAFTWLGPMVPADKWIGLGDDANPRKQQYIDAFRALIQR